MAVETRAPVVEVRLIKSRRRGEMAPGISADSRLSSLDAIDLTPMLSESGAIVINKGVRDPAGVFSITVSDQTATHQGRVLDTLYAMVEPLDLVEIRAAHNAQDYSEGPPVVMRGIVSSVSRGEDISSGRPARTVTIAGQDFGKILQILQIYYLNNSVVGDNLLTEMRFFHKYAPGDQPKTRSACAFLQQVLGNVINPYLRKFTQFANGESVGAKVINSWRLSCSIAGSVSPYVLNSFNNVSVYQMLTSILDVGPFNELFVEDTKNDIRLVARPAPFLGPDGAPIQGSVTDTITVDDRAIIAQSVMRSDAGVANYYWVSNQAWLLQTNQDAQRLASVGDPTTFILDGYINADPAFYGFRKMEVEQRLGPPGFAWGDARRKQSLEGVDIPSMADWLDRRRGLLARINRDNVVLESGTLKLVGDERIKAGMALKVKRGRREPSSWYVSRVQHHIQPFGSFITDVSVERGNDYILRNAAADAQYLQEINGGGVTDA